MRALYLGEGPCFRMDILKSLCSDLVNFSSVDIFTTPALLFIRKIDLFLERNFSFTLDLISKYLIKSSFKKLLCQTSTFDLVFVNQAAWLSPATIRLVRNHSPGAKIIVFANDDITGRRDRNRFRCLLACIPYVHLWLVCREVNIPELLALGAINVQRIWMGFYHFIHLPIRDHDVCINVYTCPDPHAKLVFIGTNISGEDRVSFLLRLINAGLPLMVIGQRWPSNSSLPNTRQQFINYVLSGRTYSFFLGHSIAVLGLLSHGNRDLHTTRSFECIAAAGCFVAERTSEHKLLFEDRYEALFWSNDDECLYILRSLCAKGSTAPFTRDSIVSNASCVDLHTFDLTSTILTSIDSALDFA